MSIGLKLALVSAAGGLGATPQNFEYALPTMQVVENDAAQTATFTTDVVDMGVGGTISITETVANVAGTSPTLTTSVLTSADNGVSDPFRAAFDVDSAASSYATAILGNMPQLTDVTTSAVRRFIVDRYLKFTHTIGGTGSPSFDMALTATKSF